MKRRIFKLESEGDKFQFPANVEVILSLQPLSVFGKSQACKRTVVKSGQVPEMAKMIYDANLGRTYAEPNALPPQLTVDFENASGHLTLNGNIVSIKSYAQNFQELHEQLESFYFAIPLLLAVEFSDPPVVERVSGKVGNVSFTWEVASRMAVIEFVTKEKQEQKVVTAWNRFSLLAVPHRRRLIGALQYFHVACRLLEAGNAPGEFLAEALLNFHKVLEVLYGSERDDVRKNLAALGFSTEEIERDFIPVMLLRSSFDVGHPMLAMFTQHQLDTLQIYAERAEKVIRKLLNKIFDAIESGQLDVPPYDVDKVDEKTQKILETLRSRLDSFELGEFGNRGK